MFCIFVPMKMTETLRQFIREHAEDDLSALLLSASRYKDVDVKLAVEQIEARARIKNKLPLWYDDDRLFYPSVLATEQCSSELTATYKQRLVREADLLCDLTGGLGVDAFFFSRKAKAVVYVEKNEAYCDAARYNLNLLGASNVHVMHADGVDTVVNGGSRIDEVRVFFIDPARRGTGNKRMFAIGDCEPDLTNVWPLLLERRCRVIVKLSPMLDISQVLTQLPGVDEVHVVSVKNECKELLMVAGGFSPEAPEPEIVCANYISDGSEQLFRFRLSGERAAVIDFAKCVKRYLYEPNASILKAGAYKSTVLRYGVEKLHVSSHLYTSDKLCTSFPGRIFETVEVIPFSGRVCKNVSSEIPRANLAVRNFPLSVDELRKRTRIADGGDTYLFATTLSDHARVLIKCRKCSLPDAVSR